MKRIIVSGMVALVAACGATSNDGVDSEVATSVVSGALNNTTGSAVGWNAPREPTYRRMFELLNPIRSAQAATWMCTGATLSPAFAGPASNPYTFTPLSCAVEWLTRKSSSSDWSTTFTLTYGNNCDDKHPFIGHQTGGCSLTRTTATGGNTRTVTGPDGNAYAVTHDTHGTSTGWDSSVSPAPNDNGLVITCASSGCEAGGTLFINGSHLIAATTLKGGATTTVWNHTVTTGAAPLTVTGSGSSRIVTGTVTVQHNLAKYTSTTTFNGVGYGDPNCCFPTSGTITTSFLSGPESGKSESLAFDNSCGEATLTTTSGMTMARTLTHCL